jgi:hypothetical protein
MDFRLVFVKESYEQARGLKGQMTPRPTTTRYRTRSNFRLNPAPPALSSLQHFVAAATTTTLEQALPQITVLPPATH